MRRKSWLTSAVPIAAAGFMAFATTTPALASATGTNGDVYGTISGPASGWNLSAHAASSFYGHLQVVDSSQLGPVYYSGPNEWNPSFNNLLGVAVSDSQVCVIGWQQNGDGSYTKVGEPCFTVYNP
jgi:hypothetical protein